MQPLRAVFGDYQGMTWHLGHDVHEGQSLVGLVDLEGGSLTAQDFCKNVIPIITHHLFPFVHSVQPWLQSVSTGRPDNLFDPAYARGCGRLASARLLQAINTIVSDRNGV